LIHLDTKWTGCKRDWDAPNRLYVNLGRLGHITVGLPQRQEQGYEWVRGQSWSWRAGYGDHWRIVTYSPPRWMMCRHRPTGAVCCDEDICGAARWHRGPHRLAVRATP